MAILASALAMAGNVVGRSVYFEVGPVRQHLNLFVALVGDTSRARKGTAQAEAARLFKECSPEWYQNCIDTGLASGEGLIKRISSGQGDVRLFCSAPELSAVLKACQRDGSTLSPSLRSVWDGELVAVMTKNMPLRADGGHVSVCGHITISELKKNLQEVEIANGLGNRFLWFYIRRNQLLPFAGEFNANVDDLKRRIVAAFESAKTRGRITWSEMARPLWEEFYRQPEMQDSLLTSITARREPLVIRLASIYAVMDESSEIRLEHLKAAFAVWEYAEESCRIIWGGFTGSKDADKLLTALRRSPAGLTRTDIVHRIFQKNKRQPEVDAALTHLENHGFAVKRIEGEVERWVLLIPPAQNDAPEPEAQPESVPAVAGVVAV